MDALDFKGGARNDFLGLSILLENSQIWQPLVHGSHRDGATAVHIGLIHINNNRVLELGKRLRHGYLDEGIQAFGNVRDSDCAICSSSLCSNELPVFQNIEHRSLQRIFRIVQLQKFEFDLRIILENQIYISFAVPEKFLLVFVRVIVEGVS